MSQNEDDPSFFDKERDRLSREITTAFEELLSSTNGLNRKLEEVLGMTKEYETIAALWRSFYELMKGPNRHDDTDEAALGLPGTGGHTVPTKHTAFDASHRRQSSSESA